MKRRTILMISIVSLLVIGAAGYYGFSGAAQQPPTPPAPQTAAVTKCDVQQTVEAPGELDNTSETQLLMPVDGNLSGVSVRAGDHVTAGQVLASLDAQLKAEAQIALKDAKEAYEKAANYLHYLQTSKKVPQSETRLFLETKRNSWMYVYKTKTFKGPAPEDWITERVRRLEELNVIQGYLLDVNPTALGLPIAAYVRIRPNPGQLPRIAELARSIPEIVECHRVTGEDCFILKVYLPSLDQLDRVLDAFLMFGTTTTSLIQSSPVPMRPPPLPSA